jgi:hypothetical protein
MFPLRVDDTKQEPNRPGPSEIARKNARIAAQIILQYRTFAYMISLPD